MAKDSIEINKNGTYTVKIIEGEGNIIVYDLFTDKQLIIIESITKGKTSTLECKKGYVIIPTNGMKIKCSK